MGCEMHATHVRTVSREMPFAIRPLEERDVAQSAEIERDAFPTLFPPTSFRRELKNQMARYLVAWRRDDLTRGATNDSPDPTQPQEEGRGPLIGRLLQTARSLRHRRHTTSEPGQFLAGFVGTWYMADEAHVVSVGVKGDYRNRGIGELLLIGAIEQAIAQLATVVTLEVRVSNHAAKNLYRKYGFEERGFRKSYYTDNREDAAIMSTDPIQHPIYQQAFRGLVSQHEDRWGRSERCLF